jgi:tetratricopeptide (TPR) repeat protein
MFGKNRLICAIFLTAICTISTIAQQNSTPKTEPEETDKAQIEYQKKLAEIEARNKQIIENNQQVQNALNDGIIAFKAKNYNLAIEKFDEAIKLDPGYWGTAPVLLTNKAMVLRTVGVNKYNEAAINKQDVSGEANQYFTDAVKSLSTALQIFSNTPIAEADLDRESFEKFKFNTLKELTECYRLLALTDKTKINEAVRAFENYIEAETDNLKKDKAIVELKKLRAGN